MAGIIFGYEAIPEKWINKLARKDYLEELCAKFEEVLSTEISESKIL